jgi:leader peptidase (prepilin peptidase)/N-methyltransferase
MIEAFTDIDRQLPWLFPAIVALYGAIIGSFLNVCILRIPEGRSVVSPRSHCACGKPIAWYDNIPVISWFILRGKARCCGRPFSFRYPAIEGLTALLFLACWLLFPMGKALCSMLLISALICATFIDLDRMIIPDIFTIWLAIVGLVLSFAVPSLHGNAGEFYLLESVRSGLSGIVGMLVGAGLLVWIALAAETILRKEAMGFGDVKFISAIGAFLGWKGAVAAVFGGALVGTCWFIIAMLAKMILGSSKAPMIKAETSEGQPAELGIGAHVPFGPMLAIAAVIYLFWAHCYIDPYFEQIQSLFSV